MYNLIDKFKRHGKLDKKEWRDIIISVLIIAFILSFRHWGTEAFSVSEGSKNFIWAIVFVGIAFFVNDVVHKTAAFNVGYKTKYNAWYIGLIIGLIVVFLTNGRLIFLAPGATIISLLTYHRLGKYYYHVTYSTLGWIAISGPLANFALAILFKIFHTIWPTDILKLAMTVFLWIALFGMLPIPPCDGSKMFFGSRAWYIFILAAMIACAIMLYYTSAILAIIFSVIIALVILFLFFAFFEKAFLGK